MVFVKYDSKLKRREQKGSALSEQRSENVVWHGGHVVRADRAERLGQQGGTVWFTGLSGSGKSTVAVSVEPLCISWDITRIGSMETTFATV